jgi:glutamate/tyrosine decarboxylase-like PLP-dependent enzyme
MSDDSERTLDPADWDAFRALAHRALDDMVDHLRGLRDRPAWRPIEGRDQAPFKTPMPWDEGSLDGAYRAFTETVQPFPMGLNHPRFWGWAAGSGTADGMLANMISAAFHSPTVLHHHAGLHVEMQLLEWLRELFGYPAGAGGMLVSGGSMANFNGLAVARVAKGGVEIRERGVGSARLAVYGSVDTHYSVPKALDLQGLGTQAFRAVPVNDRREIELDALAAMVAADRAAGIVPIAVVGTAGTIGTGAIDPLDRLADFAEREGLWFHVDGAFGAVLAFSSEHKGRLAGIERSDSLAFDFHKWLSQPYETGCILVRDAALLEATFRHGAPYTRNVQGSLSDAPVVYSDRGPELSKGFRAFALWFSLKTHGARKFGEMVEKNIRQARTLEALVERHPRLENLAPVPSCVVNFRYRGDGSLSEARLDELNARILTELHRRGIAIPSPYWVDGRFSLRVCNINHRTLAADLDALVSAVDGLGAELAGGHYVPDRTDALPGPA